MSEQQHHIMCLVETHASGAEEWSCPTCGRRFLLQWPPMYQKTVLDPGDQHATHSGSKDGLATGRMSLGISSGIQTNMTDQPEGYSHSSEPVERGDAELSSELRPWLKALCEAGLDT
jgi:hypothetical protein